ncbi:hypothetical protein Ciccas_009183 [Cichlidogyrus casuarinus]|uniref:Uncharacterized protein n=1 Tax=Cichlidogyrus casuarinus TaxID=1844966 RepID=A0ABD2PXT8_9PLAT
MFTTETTRELASENDTLPDVLDGYHNPNRPINKVASSSDEEDSDDEEDDSDDEEDDSDSEEEESESEDEKAKDRNNIRKKIENLSFAEMLTGEPQKVDYSASNTRKQTNTLLEMSKRHSSDESSEDEAIKNLQTNTALNAKISAFRQKVGYDRTKNKNR